MAKGESKSIWFRALIVLLIFTVVGFGATGFGLINTIFVNGERYAKLAEQQQLQDIVTKAKRGDIYDRNMKVLAQSATAEMITFHLTWRERIRFGGLARSFALIAEPRWMRR